MNLGLILTTLKGCIIGRKVVKVSPFMMPSIMSISSTPLDDIAVMTERRLPYIDPKLETDWC